MINQFHLIKPSLSISIFFIASTVLAQLTGDSFKNANQSKTAKFYYVHDGVVGFASEENGQYKGLLADIMKEFEAFVKQKTGIEVTAEYRYAKDGDFEAFMTDVRTGTGGVFGLSNISIKEERKKDYSFSPPYLENVSVLLTSNKVPTLAKLDDISTAFDGMTAYTLPASTYRERLVQIKNDFYPGMNIVDMPTTDPIMEKLKTDEKAFVILDLNYYIEVLQKKLPIKRHPVGDLKNDQFGIIMPKDCDWKPLMDEFLTGFYGSSKYSEIITRNLGGSALRLINSVRN